MFMHLLLCVLFFTPYVHSAQQGRDPLPILYTRDTHQVIRLIASPHSIHIPPTDNPDTVRELGNILTDPAMEQTQNVMQALVAVGNRSHNPRLQGLQLTHRNAQQMDAVRNFFNQLAARTPLVQCNGNTITMRSYIPTILRVAIVRFFAIPEPEYGFQNPFVQPDTPQNFTLELMLRSNDPNQSTVSSSGSPAPQERSTSGDE